MKKGILIIITMLTIMNISKAEPVRDLTSIESTQSEWWVESVTD